MIKNKREKLGGEEMKGIRTVSLTVLMFLSILLAQSAYASLTVFQTYTGNVALSSDGFGSTTDNGTISADVPVGATVLNAYLYSATFFGGSQAATLNGSSVAFNPQVLNTATCCDLASARADVTSIVAPIINGGPGGVYNFTVAETGVQQDGEGLVVVYSLPSLPTATVAILDGFSASGGDSASISFANPLDPTAPGFFAKMGIGDSFSCCGQESTITVNGNTLTTHAGNNDDSADGFISNGNLITVCSFDDPTSPPDPSYDQDHECYDLKPFVTLGDTSIAINTNNPSNDDNIFLETFYVSGLANVCDTPDCIPPSEAPEPGVLFLVGIGIVALWVSNWLYRRRFA